jgi:hypothetical protein
MDSYNTRLHIAFIFMQIIYVPITLAARFRAWNAFTRSIAGIVGSNPTQGMDVCVRLFCVCVVLCVGSCLATGSSPVQGVLPTMYRIKELKKRPRSNKSTAIDRYEMWSFRLLLNDKSEPLLSLSSARSVTNAYLGICNDVCYQYKAQCLWSGNCMETCVQKSRDRTSWGCWQLIRPGAGRSYSGK